MLLVDSSVWINHFRSANVGLSDGLRRREILMHPFVLGELALGGIPRFKTIADDLSDLPQAMLATSEEVIRLIAREMLAGTGIGYVDAHLVASTLLTPHTRLWTHDKKLRAVAERLSISIEVV